MESAFKIFFALAVFVFCLVVVGVFLVIVKIILLFQPAVNLMGLIIS